VTFADAPIRELAAADLLACSDLAETRGWPREERKWGLLHDVGNVYGVDAPDGGLAAAAVSVAFGPVAALSMVLVAERFGRQGLGRRITAHAVDAAGDRVVTLFASKFGRPLYESMGFVVDGGTQGHVGIFSGDGGPEARPAERADFAAVHRLDAEAQDADREPLLRRLWDSGSPYVVERGGEVRGFAFGTFIGHVTVIGPVVADDEEQARALIRGVAGTIDGELRVDPDLRFPGLSGWVRARGLVPTATAPRMVLDGRALPGDPARRFAPFTRALG